MSQTSFVIYVWIFLYLVVYIHYEVVLNFLDLPVPWASIILWIKTKIIQRMLFLSLHKSSVLFDFISIIIRINIHWILKSEDQMIEALKKLNGQFFWHSILFFICAFSNNGRATQAKLTMKSNNLKHFLWKVFLKRTVAAVSYCRRQLHYYSSLPLLAFPYFSLYLLLVIIKKCWSTNREIFFLIDQVGPRQQTNNWKACLGHITSGGCWLTVQYHHHHYNWYKP